jgi:hypothetical protein
MRDRQRVTATKPRPSPRRTIAGKFQEPPVVPNSSLEKGFQRQKRQEGQKETKKDFLSFLYFLPFLLLPAFLTRTVRWPMKLAESQAIFLTSPVVQRRDC